MIQGLIERQAVVRLVVFMTVVFGAYTYFGYLPREASPDVKIPVVMVSTPYVGVAPKDIESLVTNPLENELAGRKRPQEDVLILGRGCQYYQLGVRTGDCHRRCTSAGS